MGRKYEEQWTEEHKQFLRDNIGKFTFQEIANKLHMTRNAVYAKSRRMGLEYPWESGIKNTIHGKYIGQNKRERESGERIRTSKETLAAIVPLKPEFLAPEPCEQVEPIARRTKIEPCCWVLEMRPTRYCDAPSFPGSSWCPEHRAIAVSRTKRSLLAAE